MQVRVLGQVEAGDDGRSYPLGGPTQRRVFAALVARRGETVGVSELVEVSWPDGNVSDGAEHNVRSYIHRLRTALRDDGDRIDTVGTGYRLSLGPDEVDVDRFEELATRAARSLATGDAVVALDAIAEAESLWHGRPFGEFADEPWAEADVARLTELRLSMHENRAEALLIAGRASDAVVALEWVVREEPYRERPRALLMRALYESGRQADALRAYQDFRRLLIDDVGVEPSRELAELDREIAVGALESAPGRTLKVGNYELHERIGEGAFAIVHRATQTSLGREVAVKIVRADLANRPEFIRRFEAEAQMVAAIEHPNVVPLYDYWREPGQAFLVMRWMTGGSLESRLDHGRWPLDRTLDVIDQIAAGLDAAHAHGVVHRDVKPANILFDDAGRAYLGDFGIALTSAELATPQAALSEGSPVFASPEQLRREPVGPEADVHALAIVAFAMLVGRTPFADSPDEATLLRRQLGEAIPPVSSRRSDLPTSLDDVIAIAAAKRPSDRYPTASGFAIALRSAASGGVTVPPSVGAVARRNPYKGLRAFDETDAVDFFGRDRLVDELVAHLRTSDGRFLAVVGPSGSGKSSVVRAGLIPALREGRVPGSSDWFTTTMIPGTHPFESLETALLRVAVNPPSALIDQLRDGDRGILRGVKRILPDDRAVIAVVIDQAEELFNGGVEPDERDRFLGALATAVEATGSPLRLVITLRADFYGGPLRDPRFAPLLRRNTIAVGPLAPDELEEAVTGPSRGVGVAIEPGLIAELIADVNSQPGTLPLLQYALTQAFDHGDDDVLTVDAYRSIGGLAGALGRRAEELWQAADRAERVAARRLFGRLVTLGEGIEDTRRRARISELGDDAATRATVDRFGAARLLTFDHDPATREPTVEVAHEALIREWSRLRTWLDDDRDSLRLQRHLTNAASAWVDRDRDPNELYRGARLDASEPLLTGDTVTLNDIEAEFLRASLQRRRADDAAARLRVRRMRRLVTATAIVAVVALLAGAVALVQWRRADDQAADAAANAEQAATNQALAEANAAEAAENAELAEQRATEAEQARARGDLERLRAVALSTAGQSPTIAALLAVESHRLEPSTDSLDVLHRVMTEIPGYRGSMPARPYHAAELLDDGVTLVAAGAETVDVWDLRRREMSASIDHASPTGAAVVRVIDDDHVAVLGDQRDETIVYDLASGTEVARIAHAAIVNDISVSSDGERGAFAMEGGAVEVWNLGNDELAATLDTGDIDAYIARWSPHDGLLAVVTLQSEVQLWDVDEQVRVWSTGPSDASIVNQVRPYAAAFSPDGSRYVLLSGSIPGELRIIDSSDGSDAVPPMPTPGLRGFPLGDIYWIDDATVVIPSDDNVMAYPLDTPAPAARTVVDQFVSKGNSVVYSAALDQHIVAGHTGLEFWSAAGSGPLERLIPAPPEQLAGGGIMLTSLAPDGTRLIMSTLRIPVNPPATSFDLTRDPPVSTVLDPMVTIGFGEFTLAGMDFAWQILDVDLEPLGAPVPLPFDFSDLGVSEDGRYVAIGRLGGMADVYTGSGELVGTVELGGPAEFAGAQVLPTFTSDGEFLALSSTDGRSGLWATEGLERIDRPAAQENSWTLALGPWLFVAGGAGTFQRIDPTTMEPVGGAVGLNGLDSPGYAGVDQTHARLAATGPEVAKVFDLDAERQLGRDLPLSGGGVSRVEFSADGAILAVPTASGITLWNFDTDTWPDVACLTAGRNLTRDEWERFGPRTIEYRATCPGYPIES